MCPLNNPKVIHMVNTYWIPIYMINWLLSLLHSGGTIWSILRINWTGKPKEVDITNKLDGKADSQQKGVAHDYKGKCSHLQTSNMNKEVMDESANKLK
jgi:hypothetical protein